MESLRFVALFAIFAFLQSNSVAQDLRSNNEPFSVIRDASSERTLGDSQNSPLHFANAVIYNSGGSGTASIAVADVNGDGHPDLIVGSGDVVGVLLGNGNGTFRAAVTYSVVGANSIAIGDLNGDGYPDIVVADGCYSCSASEVQVLLGNGDGTFQPPVSYESGGSYSYSVAIADLNGDGRLDLAVANLNTGSVGVLLGDGDGTFQSAVPYYAFTYGAVSVAIGDVNDDGKPDLVVGGGGAVLLGNGDGTFQSPLIYTWGCPLDGECIAIGDLNGDRKPDVVVANSSIGVLIGNGDGTFQPAAYYWPGGFESDAVAIGDVNGDGHPDILVASYCAEGKHGENCNLGSVSALLGNGDGSFQAALAFKSGGTDAVAVAVSDVNGDGKPDVIIANRCSDPVYCRNGTVGVLLNKTLSVTTTTALTSSINPSHVNQPVTFTATIASSSVIPDGEPVTFFNGKVKIGTCTTLGGVATMTTSFAKPKTYTIKASYSGDGFRKSSSGTEKQVVIP